MKRTLNDRLIRALKPAAAGRRYEVKDIVVPGLAVRVTDNGRRTYVLRRRYPGSTHANRRALGDCGVISLDDARTKARAWLEMIARDVDPRTQEERQRQVERGKRRNTFAAVAEDFDKLPGERKGYEAERDIRREFMPAWANRPIAEITPRDVRDIVKAVNDRGTPYQAHNIFVLARRLFAWTVDQHVYGLETSPCDRLKPKALVGKRSARTLTGDELGALWKAAESLGYPYGPLFRLLALTGQRKSEVAEARWSEFDLAAKLWTIPAERMKADAAHVVPLTDDVIKILSSLPRFNEGEHLFSTDSGVKPVDGFSNGKVKLDKAMAAELGRVVDPFVIHDIRRTMRTGLSTLPIPDLVRELVIAHSKPGLHKVYDQHAYLDEKRRALDLWAAKLRSIIEPQPANVITLQAVS